MFTPLLVRLSLESDKAMEPRKELEQVCNDDRTERLAMDLFCHPVSQNACSLSLSPLSISLSLVTPTSAHLRELEFAVHSPSVSGRRGNLIPSFLPRRHATHDCFLKPIYQCHILRLVDCTGLRLPNTVVGFVCSLFLPTFISRRMLILEQNFRAPPSARLVAETGPIAYCRDGLGVSDQIFRAFVRIDVEAGLLPGETCSKCFVLLYSGSLCTSISSDSKWSRLPDGGSGDSFLPYPFFRAGDI
ncbi:unnamed protein product [Protopolystoma xenopodis]|uniref:Uncharacterized protein n=1 Tax=Protopolystoma xenopodis TaxID=117903 RepID=A0A448WC84_9PLAT|nr:unnamed protein product [Protopolystoma xenopodis]